MLMRLNVHFNTLLIIIPFFALTACKEIQLPGDETHPTPDPLFLCSFNIQFVGVERIRDNETLAQILNQEGCDLVAVQELVAMPDLRALPSSPHYGQQEITSFPDGTLHRPLDRATNFFLAMYEVGYDGFILSEEDTSRTNRKHQNSTGTEYWVTFYRKSRLTFADDLPHGFLSDDLRENPIWDRVPYAFAFRNIEETFDFVLISTHLRHGSGREDYDRRAGELHGIKAWIDEMKKINSERDYIILGDMNIQGAEELHTITPKGYVPLNTDAQHMTNTNLNGPMPYDHVMISPNYTKEIPTINNFFVLDLIELARPFWQKHIDLAVNSVGPPPPYPGDPYTHNLFRRYFSDHHPIGFWALPTHTDRD